MQTPSATVSGQAWLASFFLGSHVPRKTEPMVTNWLPTQQGEQILVPPYPEKECAWQLGLLKGPWPTHLNLLWRADSVHVARIRHNTETLLPRLVVTRGIRMGRLGIWPMGTNELFVLAPPSQRIAVAHKVIKQDDGQLRVVAKPVAELNRLIRDGLGDLDIMIPQELQDLDSWCRLTSFVEQGVGEQKIVSFSAKMVPPSDEVLLLAALMLVDPALGAGLTQETDRTFLGGMLFGMNVMTQKGYADRFANASQALKQLREAGIDDRGLLLFLLSSFSLLDKPAQTDSAVRFYRSVKAGHLRQTADLLDRLETGSEHMRLLMAGFVTGVFDVVRSKKTKYSDTRDAVYQKFCAYFRKTGMVAQELICLRQLS